MTDDLLPTVPGARLDDGGWSELERSEETLATIPTGQVRGHTIVFEDAHLRDAIREATGGDLDRIWRIFFATRIAFVPPLPPGVGTAMVASTVRRNALAGFVADLKERGFPSVDQRRDERVRVASGQRAQLRFYDATVEIEVDGDRRTLPFEGIAAVWSTGGTFRMAGGAHPATELDDALALDLDVETPQANRDALIDLIRAVE
jgi:hypothetical protein